MVGVTIFITKLQPNNFSLLSIITMFKYLILLTIFLIIIYAQECEKTEENKPITEEKRLRNDLLCNYNKHFVPMFNKSAKMEIAVTMNVLNYDISGMGPKKLYIESEMTVLWKDAFLKWNPEDYNSITEILMSTDEIWSPEIMPEEMDFFSRKSSILATTECKVTSAGAVSCTVTSSHTGFCHSDDKRWPYDEHICEVQYLCVSHRNEFIWIEWPTVENGTLTVEEPEDSEWRITSQSDQWILPSGMQSELRVVEAYFEFELVRMVGQEMGFMFLSIFVLISLSLMSFWASFESSDRVILCLINIICHTWEIENLEWKFSRLGHTVPYILCFYRDSLILALVILVETMIFKKILISDKPTPNWLAIVGRNVGKETIRKILFIEAINSFDPKNGEQGSFEDELKFIQQSNQFAKKRIIQIIDRLVFVIFLVTYFIMSITLLTF